MYESAQCSVRPMVGWSITQEIMLFFALCLCLISVGCRNSPDPREWDGVDHV